ncbi:Tc toxin subunit A [Xenorhabdus nematophila]|uniref:Tc toxin subunit A n=1 Tax=Xenorhabdus nematophila TaxID=628 RepID=UPI0032B7C98F
MTQTTLPLKTLETSCRLKSGTLAALGLTSLQAILAYTENDFTDRFRSKLGRDGARAVYRTAQTGQQQLIKLYRKTHQRNGQAPQNIKVEEEKDSPTWNAQFPEKGTVVPPGSIGDSSSPASYATSLYVLATELEGIERQDDSPRTTLAIRRPDLGDTLLNDVTVNQPLPKLDIVNGILQSSLDNASNNQKLVNQLKRQGILPDSVTRLPSDTLLSRLHYPGNALPYHEPHDQVVTGLSEHKTNLAALTQVVGASRPAFSSKPDKPDIILSARVLQQAAGLSPSVVRIMTDAFVFNTASTHKNAVSPVQSVKQSGFFPYNFGFRVPDMGTRCQLSLFTQATGLSGDETMQLLCVAGIGEHNTSVVASTHVKKNDDISTNEQAIRPFPAPCHYGAVFIHGGSDTSSRLFLSGENGTGYITGLTQPKNKTSLYDRYDRINRMVRLQRGTGLPFDQLDNLVMAAIHAERGNNPSREMNTHTVRTLGFYQRWHEAYDLKAEDLAAFLHEVTPFAVGTALPQFDRLFNPRTRAGQTPLLIDNTPFDFSATDGADAVTVRQLCAGLAISEAEFQILADKVSTARKPDARKLTRSLSVVSALYRLSKIPALLGIRVAEMLTLLELMPRGKTLLDQLAGEPQLAPLDGKGQPTEPDLLDDLQALADMVNWLKAQRLSVADVTLLLTPVTPPASQAEVALINDINQHLNNIRFDADSLNGLGLPVVDTKGNPLNWLTLLTTGSDPVVDSAGLTTSKDETALQKAVTNIVNAQKVSDDARDSTANILNSTLTGVLRSQQTLIDTQLGKVLKVSHGVVLAMLSCLSFNSYTLLKACQDLNKPGLSPADIPDNLMKQFNEFARYSLLVTRYRLTPATLRAMQTYPAAFGGSCSLSLSLLPVMADYTAWRHAAGKEDEVLQYLHDVNASLSVEQIASRLAIQLHWSKEEVQKASVLVTRSADGRITTVAQIGHLMRLRVYADKTGLSINLLQQIAGLTITEAVLDDKATGDTDFDTWRAAGLAVMATLNSGDSKDHA